MTGGQTVGEKRGHDRQIKQMSTGSDDDKVE